MRHVLPRLVILSIAAALLAPAMALTPAGRLVAPVASAAPATIHLGPGGGSGDCAAPSYTTGDLAVAIAVASAGDTIHLCAGTYGVSAGISFGKPLTFAGDGSANTFVDGSAGVTPTTTGIFISTTTGTIAFSAMTIRNGNRPASQGGAISASARVLLSNLRIVDNRAFACGAVRAGSVTMTGTTVEGNRAQGGYHAYGGALCLGSGYYSTVAGPSTITDSSFIRNHEVRTDANSWGYGGAIFSSNAGSELTISRSRFEGNTARGVDGSVAGAVYAESRIKVSDSEFIDNLAVDSGYGGWGGAIDAETGIDVTSSTFVGNLAPNGGGGAIEIASSATIVNSTFVDNSAGSGIGGALHSWTTPAFFSLTNNTFRANSASDGGAIASLVWDSGSARYVGADFTSGNNVFASISDTCSGRLSDRGGNIAVSDGTAPNGCIDPAVVESRALASAATLSLGTFADYGGRTRTIAIGADSVARAAGVVALCAAGPIVNRDQRGYGRHATDPAPTCSSGAYEFGGRAPLTVTPASRTIAAGTAKPGSAFYTATVTGFINGETASTATDYVAPVCGSAYEATTGVAASPLAITCTGGSASDYLFDVSATATLTITPATPTLELTASSGVTVEGDTTAGIRVVGPIPGRTPTGTVTIRLGRSCGTTELSSGTLALDASGGANLTWRSTSSGTFYWQATYGGDADHAAATSACIPMTVLAVGDPVVDPVDGGSGGGGGGFAAPAPQTITFTLPASATAGSRIALTGTASSGLAITYTSATSSVCTVSGATLTLVTVGTCRVAAAQAGDAMHAAATTVTRSIAVTARPALSQRLFGIGATGKWVALTASTATRGSTVIDQLQTSVAFAGRRAELWSRTATGTWVRRYAATLDRAGSATYRFSADAGVWLKWRVTATATKPALWSAVTQLRIR